MPPNAAFLSQVPQLISDSVADNVGLGPVTDDALTTALELAAIADDIDADARRRATLIGPRGLRLSGGQRQRLATARALVHVTRTRRPRRPVERARRRDRTRTLDATSPTAGMTVLAVSHRASPSNAPIRSSRSRRADLPRVATRPRRPVHPLRSVCGRHNAVPRSTCLHQTADPESAADTTLGRGRCDCRKLDRRRARGSGSGGLAIRRCGGGRGGRRCGCGWRSADRSRTGASRCGWRRSRGGHSRSPRSDRIASVPWSHTSWASAIRMSAMHLVVERSPSSGSSGCAAARRRGSLPTARSAVGRVSALTHSTVSSSVRVGQRVEPVEQVAPSARRRVRPRRRAPSTARVNP